MRILSNTQSGQTILIFILIMTVALVIGLSIVQRSLSDISTSSKVEQSSRAFSAAEAGIERALRDAPSTDKTFNIPSTELKDSNANVTVKANLPAAGQALEYPPVGREEIVHVWLIDPDNNLEDPTFSTAFANPYTGATLDVYWGNPGASGADKPALELTLISATAGSPSPTYSSQKFFYDMDSTRTGPPKPNGFIPPPGGCSTNPSITTSLSPTVAKSFFCKVTISIPGGLTPVILRGRLLYTSTAHPFAVAPAANVSLPKQAILFDSTGTSGDVKRSVRLFKLKKVVSPYFDYALFSAGEIKK